MFIFDNHKDDITEYRNENKNLLKPKKTKFIPIFRTNQKILTLNQNFL